MRCLAFLLALPLAAQSPEALAMAERAFAHRAQVVGTRAAFLAFLADDAVLFRPRPTAGPAHIAKGLEDGSRLEWHPDYVEVSRSGDFGLSTGPYAWTPRGSGHPQGYGHFLSIWGQHQGKWQVLLDVGVPHDEAPPVSLQGRRSQAEPLDPEQAKRLLLEAEEAMDQLSVTLPFPSALREWGAQDLRIYRPGLVPQPGNLGQGCRRLPSRLTWVRRGLLMAPSGDLACTYGESDEAQAKEGRPKASRSSAVRVWRREQGMGWRLLVDLAIPIPDAASRP